MDDARAAVDGFKASAERFVALVDECVAGPEYNDDGLSRVGVQLAELYSRAAQIPDVELTDAATDIDVAGDSSMDTSRFHAVLAKLRAVIGATVDWGTLEHAFEIKREEALVDLHLAEVYRDVVNDLARIANGERDGDAAWASAVWEVRFGFWNHWGHHAASAMRPLHAQMDVGGSGPRYQHHPANLLSHVRDIETAGLDEEELALRTEVARHLAQVAKANGQDERASFRAAFEMSVRTARQISELHVGPGEPGGPLTELERAYLSRLDPP
jgi:hypothetical protein